MPGLVRAVIGDQEVNVSAGYAKTHKLEVLKGEPTRRDDGRPRTATRRGGRPAKPKTSVADAAAEKKADKPANVDNPPSKE